MTAGLALTAVACGSDKPGTVADDGSVTVKHAFGETKIPKAPSRVVSAGFTEQDDLLAVVDWMRTQTAWSPEVATLPLALGGFSFGSFVQTHVARRLAEAGTPAQRLVLVGTATSRWDVATVPADTIVIHGEQDDTVPLGSVLDWARPQDLPVIVIPGADHFFHRKLHLIKQLVVNAWER